MSTNKAPDKIFITEDFAKFAHLDKPVPIQTSPYKQCVEYIRKDAILELAERQDALCSQLPQTDSIVGERMAYQKIIDKIKSM